MTPAEIERGALPVSDALRFDALLVPANRRASGSSWYDAFALSDERFAVSLGTVAGGDLEPAPAMLALRNAAAGLGMPADPAALLSAAYEALRRQAAAAGVMTALIGVIDTAAQTFTYRGAGHPPPYLRYHDGDVGTLPACGLPFDPAQREQPFAQVVVDLAGAALLLLNSGALEAGDDAGAGAERLHAVLGDERIAHCVSPAGWIARRMLDAASHDGAALLALTFPGSGTGFGPPTGQRPKWKASWSFDSNAAAANGVRRAFLACLASKRGGCAVDLAAAELIFGELLGNVVRHAPGPVEIALDWTTDLPVLHVLDSGPGFRSRRKRERLPVDDLSESGRGLFIVNACATHFTVRNRNGRGTHASATLPAA